MSSQPTPAPATISLPAAVLLGVAATAAATLAVIIAVQSIVNLRVYEGTTALLAALVALTGTGVIICVVADRVMRRLDQLESAMAHRPVGSIDADTVAAAERVNLRLLNGKS